MSLPQKGAVKPFPHSRKYLGYARDQHAAGVAVLKEMTVRAVLDAWRAIYLNDGYLTSTEISEIAQQCCLRIRETQKLLHALADVMEVVGPDYYVTKMLSEMVGTRLEAVDGLISAWSAELEGGKS